MKLESKTKVDFRYMALLPVLCGYGLLLFFIIFPKVVTQVAEGYLGEYGIYVYFAVTIVVLRYNQTIFYPLAKIHHKNLLSTVKDYVIVDIEDAESYHKIKVVGEDIGVVYPQNGKIIMRTNTALYDITDELLATSIVSPGRPDSKMKAIKIRFDQNENESVIKPIYPGYNFIIQGDGQKKAEWFFEKIRSWQSGNSAQT